MREKDSGGVGLVVARMDVAQKELAKIGVVWLRSGWLSLCASSGRGRGTDGQPATLDLSGYGTSFGDDLDHIFQGRGEYPVQRSAMTWIKCHSIEVI